MSQTAIKRRTWQERVVELLDDPVGRAILERDGLSRDEVIARMAAIAAQLRPRAESDDVRSIA